MPIQRKLEKKLKNSIKKGEDEINPFYKFVNGVSTIHYACLYDNFKLVKKCLKNGVDLNLKGGKYQNTPIYFAIYNRNHRIVLFLLERGAQDNRDGVAMSELCVKLEDFCGLLLVEQFLGRNAKIKETAKQMGNINLMNYCRGHESSTWAQICCAMLFLSSYIYNQDVYFVAILYFLFSDLMINIKAALFLNFFYSFEILIKTTNYSKKMIIFNIIYFILLFCLIKKDKKGKGKDSQNLKKIREAIEKKTFCDKYFCYICVSGRSDDTKHCYYCNICVKKFDHHCPCIDRCIDSSNFMIYHVYLVYSMAFIIIFCFFIERTFKPKVLAGFIIFVCFLRLIAVFSKMRKKYLSQKNPLYS